eukprot:6461622-Amphidinium_carterae.1
MRPLNIAALDESLVPCCSIRIFSVLISAGTFGYKLTDCIAHFICPENGSSRCVASLHLHREQLPRHSATPAAEINYSEHGKGWTATLSNTAPRQKQINQRKQLRVADLLNSASHALESFVLAIRHRMSRPQPQFPYCHET